MLIFQSLRFGDGDCDMMMTTAMMTFVHGIAVPCLAMKFAGGGGGGG